MASMYFYPVESFLKEGTTLGTEREWVLPLPLPVLSHGCLIATCLMSDTQESNWQFFLDCTDEVMPALVLPGYRIPADKRSH